MRVLQVGKYYYPEMGGIENHLYVLCGELRTAVQLEVVVGHTERHTVRERIEEVPVTRCGALLRVASTSVCLGMRSELSRRSYDVVHLHLPNPMGVAAYLFSRKPRSHAVVVTYHSDVVRQKRLYRAISPMVEEVLGRASVVVCTSPQYVDTSEVLRRYHEKCRVIPYGIDTTQFESTPETVLRAQQLRREYGEPLVLGVGRLIYYKGFDVLVRAMRDVPAHLLLVGDGPLRPELERLAETLGIADRVHFAGNVHNRDLAPYYHACDVFVLPSVARSEAFGIVQLEAMCCRKPVVNTALNSGVPFVSVDGETGITVPPESEAALSEALRRLILDPDLAADLGRRGRGRVRSMFAKEVMRDETLALYAEALRSR